MYICSGTNSNSRFCGAFGPDAYIYGIIIINSLISVVSRSVNF